MIGKIQHSNLYFKFASLEWLNFYGVSFYFFALSILDLYFLYISSEQKFNDYLSIFFALVTLTSISYYVQKRKLKFKVIAENSNISYDSLKQILLDEHWFINAHRKSSIIQVTRKDSSDLLTFVLEKNSLKWSLIYHPYNRNSLMSLFAINKNGKRIIKKIKTAST